MYRLQLLGGASLTGPSGPVSGRVGHRQRLALLALLAEAGAKGCSRDKLVAYLWPESDTSHARHRLSDSLYVLRQALGDDPVVVVGEHMWLNRELVQADLLAFEEALERDDREAAAALYAGPFLDGFHLGGSQEFEDWLEAERTRLAELHAKALESLAQQAEGAGDLARAAEWWKQLLAADPYNSRITVRLVEALAGAGDPANAIQQALAHERLLRDELDMEPAPEVRALVERLRAEPAPAERFESVRVSAEGVGDSATETPSTRVVSRVGQPPGRWNHLAEGLAAIAVVATLAAVWGWLRPVTRDADRAVAEFYLDPPESTMSLGFSLVLSPDGRRLVSVVDTEEGSVLYQRMLDERGWRIVPGTEGALWPFFSPDGEWLGFASSREGCIKKVPVEGGSAQTIARVHGSVQGASWGPNDTLVFAVAEMASGRERSSLYHVTADGGVPQRLTALDTALGEVGYRDPHYLPGGEVVLLTAVSPLFQTVVSALSLESRRISRLIPGMTPQSDGAGRVVYVTSDGTAVAQTFNPRTLALEGAPRPIAEGIAIAGGILASYAVSSDGSLAYLSGSNQGGPLVLVNREGEIRPLFSSGVGSNVGSPRFSPTGDRIAFALDGDVWVYSLAEGTARRLSFEGAAADPAWTSDGRSIGYSVAGEGSGPSASLYLRAADGTGSVERILASDRDLWQMDFAPGDSEVVLYSDYDVFRASLGSDSGPVPLMETEAFVEHPTLSPDGRWVAYKSNESGIDEVYVRSYPDMGPPTVVSVGGGGAAAWSGDGSEIFYWGPSRMMVASLDYDGYRVTVVGRTELFRTRPFRRGWNRNYDVHPSGQEFVMVGGAETRAVWRVHALAGER